MQLPPVVDILVVNLGLRSLVVPVLFHLHNRKVQNRERTTTMMISMSPVTRTGILNKLKLAIAELEKLDEQSGGAIDLTAAIDALRRAIIELESTR